MDQGVRGAHNWGAAPDRQGSSPTVTEAAGGEREGTGGLELLRFASMVSVREEPQLLSEREGRGTRIRCLEERKHVSCRGFQPRESFLWIQ